MKRILLVLAIMVCSVQLVSAYTFQNTRLTATVSASGQVTYLKVDGLEVSPMMIEAAVGYENITPTTWVNSMTLNSVTSNPNYVTAVYRKNNVLGGTLVVGVKTKLVGENPYLDQRYTVTYWKGGTGILNDVKVYLYVQGNGDAESYMMGRIGVAKSTWDLNTSDWPNPVDGANSGYLMVTAYIPGKTDDHQSGMPSIIRTAIEQDSLNGSDTPGNAAGMMWEMGTVKQTDSHIHALDARATAVPEPCTMVLTGIGLLGLFGIRRKRA